jgi:hypothetical protein
LGDVYAHGKDIRMIKKPAAYKKYNRYIDLHVPTMTSHRPLTQIITEIKVLAVLAKKWMFLGETMDLRVEPAEGKNVRDIPKREGPLSIPSSGAANKIAKDINQVSRCFPCGAGREATAEGE